MNPKPTPSASFTWGGLVTIRGKAFVSGNAWKMWAARSRPSSFPAIRPTAPEFSNWKRKCQKRWKNITGRIARRHRARSNRLGLATGRLGYRVIRATRIPAKLITKYAKLSRRQYEWKSRKQQPAHGPNRLRLAQESKSELRMARHPQDGSPTVGTPLRF